MRHARASGVCYLSPLWTKPRSRKKENTKALLSLRCSASSLGRGKIHHLGASVRWYSSVLSRTRPAWRERAQPPALWLAQGPGGSSCGPTGSSRIGTGSTASCRLRCDWCTQAPTRGRSRRSGLRGLAVSSWPPRPLRLTQQATRSHSRCLPEQDRPPSPIR